MANYYATARSNYFRVKDPQKFEEWCNEIGVQMITKEEKKKKGTIVHCGFLCNGDDSGSMPYYVYNQETGEERDITIEKELAEHLMDDEVAILMETGAEEMRYLTGYAIAINSKGETNSIGLEDIYDMAKKLGKNITRAEY